MREEFAEDLIIVSADVASLIFSISQGNNKQYANTSGLADLACSVSRDTTSAPPGEVEDILG